MVGLVNNFDKTSKLCYNIIPLKTIESNFILFHSYFAQLLVLIMKEITSSILIMLI